MRITDLETPALLVDADALARNMDAMNRLLAGSNLALRPHYKSHKCIAIAKMQLEHGAKGITCAKLGEAEDLASAGVEDILIANEIVQPSKILRLAALAGRCRLTVCVDDKENIAALSKAAAAADSTIHCYVEYNIGAGRCGARSEEECIALVEAVANADHLTFDGIQAYASWLSHTVEEDVRRTEVARIEHELLALKAKLEARGYPVKEVSGGSSGTAALKRESKVYTELQAGSYLFMDATYQQLGLIFENSVSLLTTVISAHADALITDAGVKSCGVDQTKARIAAPGLYLDGMNEEHGIVKGDIAGYRVGDMLRYIPGHSCTTFNLHDFVYLIRGDQVVDKLPVTSRGKIQ